MPMGPSLAYALRVTFSASLSFTILLLLVADNYIARKVSNYFSLVLWDLIELAKASVEVYREVKRN